MGEQDEVATAIAGREHWRRDGRGAVYTPAGTLATVRVLPIVDATRRERFVAVIAGEGRAEHSLPCGTAVEAARWSERVRLS